MIINQRVWWDGLGAISHGLFSLLALRHPALAEAENIDIDHAVVLNLSCRMCTSIPPWKEVKNRQNREGVQILYWWTMHQKEISDLVDLLWVRFVIWSTTSACFPAFGCIHLFSATPHTAWKSVLGDWPKSYRTSHLSPTRAINCPVSFWGRPHAWYGCGHML